LGEALGKNKAVKGRRHRTWLTGEEEGKVLAMKREDPEGLKRKRSAECSSTQQEVKKLRTMSDLKLEKRGQEE